MNPVCIWNRAFRWLFAITTFFLSASFMWNTSCSFKKTVTSFMCSFKKLSPVSSSFKKLSPVSCTVSKKTVTFLCSGGETIRLFAKKKHDYKVWFWQLAKKLFFELQNVETLTDFFFWQIFWNFTFFFSNFFSIWQFWIDFLCIIFFRFFQIYTTTADFIKLKWNWEQFHWKYLKLFEIICKCHSFTETGCKKKSLLA